MINEKLVSEFTSLLKEREDEMAAMKEQQSALIAQIAGQEQALKVLQAARTPSRERLVAMGRYTAPVKARYRGVWDDEKKEAFLEFMCGVLKNDKDTLREFYGRYLTQKASDLAIGTAAQGGYLVPDDFIPEIFALMLQESVYLPNARRFPMRERVMEVPTKASGWTTYWGSEGGTITQGEPTFGLVTLTAQKLVGFGKISSELLDDSAPDIAEYLMEQAVEGAASAIDTAGFRDPGDSTGLPDAVHTGILLLAGNVVTCGTTGSFSPSFSELVDGICKLTAQKDVGARLWMSKYTFGNIKKLTDTDGAPIWVPTIGDPDKDLIAGVPYTIVDRMPGASAVTKDCDFMLYGNLDNVMYGDRREFRFQRSDDFLFQTDQVALRFTQRIAFPNLTTASEVKNAFVRWRTTSY